MIVKLIMASVFLIVGFAIGINMAGNDPVDARVNAINVVGSQVTTISEDDATFQVFKTSVQTLETDVAKLKVKAKVKNKDGGDKIALEAGKELEFLNNFHQTLADIQLEFPCPSLEDWEAAGGVPGGNEPNPTEFPDCDPDVLYDPARCNFFWEDLIPQVAHPTIIGNQSDTLTSRNTMITFSWNGTIYNNRLRNPSTNPADYPDNC